MLRDRSESWTKCHFREHCAAESRPKPAADIAAREVQREAEQEIKDDMAQLINNILARKKRAASRSTARHVKKPHATLHYIWRCLSFKSNNKKSPKRSPIVQTAKEGVNLEAK